MSEAVAVVIPAYNAARWLPRTLQSLQEQTHRPAEVVVVDDGSTDGTAEVATRHGATLLRQRQRGPGAARNLGVSATRSPWIAFLDADDWFLPTRLERQLAELARLGAQAICADAFVVRDEVVGRRKNEGRAVPAVLTAEQLLRGNPVICSSVLVARPLLEQAGMFDEDPVLIATEDYDLWLRVAEGHRVCYLDEPLCCYRVHAGSLSANERFLRGVDRIMDKFAGRCGGEPRLLRLVRERRAAVRLDLAWDLLQQGGRGAAARQRIREAQRLAFSWKGIKLGLRSLLPR